MFARLEEKIKKLTVMDMSLVKLSAMFFGILVAKIFPTLLNLSYPALIILVLACGIKPFYSVWIKK